jgi:serine/threonine protein kinase
MKEHLTECSDDALKRLLQEVPNQEADIVVIGHVEHCVHCQSRLYDLAATSRDWNAAKASLSSFDSLEYSREEKRYLAHAENPGETRDEKSWMEEFTRQWLQPPRHPELLGRIGRFDVERWIGSGGMGVVYKAFDTELNRPVAIKILAPYLAGIGAARQRFGREARAAAAIVHEHVVAIHNVESNSESPYLVMQYVAGESLQQRLDRTGALELCELLRIAKQTAAGLVAAHAQGLVHRDVKPSNILLEEGIERALLTDFGLARAADDASLTHTGYHPGTPEFMSPEQARGETVDVRSDLFSLGSVMYAMCTGRSPFRAESSYGVLRKITDAEPIAIRELNPSIPEWLALLVQKLHAKQPADRWNTASEVHDLLEGCLAHVQNPTSVELPQTLQPSPRRGWWQRMRRDSSGTRKAMENSQWQTLYFMVGCMVVVGGVTELVMLAPTVDRAKPSRANSAIDDAAKEEVEGGNSENRVMNVTPERVAAEKSWLDWDWGDAELRAIESSSVELGNEAQKWDSEPRGN